MSDNLVDPQRAQKIRERCNRAFAGRSIHDVVGAVQMLTADAITFGLPGLTKTKALAMADAIAADVRNIIRERYAMQGEKH